MFRIGEFARLSRVSVKALRYYDEIGLLEPSYVDRFTSYRYYLADQLPRLNRILALKDLGLSLDEIATLLDGDLPAEQIRGMLRMKQAEIQHRVDAEGARLARVEARLRQIEQEGAMPKYEVVIKEVKPQMVMGVRDIIATFPDVGRLFGEVERYVAQHGGKPSGACMAIYYDDGSNFTNIDAEAATPVVAPLPESDRVKCHQIPGVKTVAATLHKGPYDGLTEAYNALVSWTETNGYRIVGHSREVYLRGHTDSDLKYPKGSETDDPNQFLTEIQFPVEKK